MIKINVIQANINRSRPALDLLLQQAKELRVGLLAISEPNNVPDAPNWFSSLDRGAAVFVDSNLTKLRCTLAHKGDKYVAVNCGPYLVVSLYISPNVGLREYNALLDELSATLASRLDKVILCGDFNAKSRLWGSGMTDARGFLLSSWAAERDVRIVNEGNIPTCVRPQGSSIVDLTWSSPDLIPFIRKWRVMDDTETLSDHCYVSFSVETARQAPPLSRNKTRRWNLRKFNTDHFLATLHWHERDTIEEQQFNLEGMTSWLDKIMEEACDAAAPRVGPKKPKRQAYWWNVNAASLRHDCIRARRTWQRAKRRRRPENQVQELGEIYKSTRKKLRNEINNAKSSAWQELINTIEKDPWGLPYKLVLRKLKPATSTLTEILEPEILSELLDSLFPKCVGREMLANRRDFGWCEDWSVSPAEVARVVKKRTVPSSKAPGPDGFKAVTWKLVTHEILERMRHIYDRCLIDGVFPKRWKMAGLVLIPKANKSGTSEPRVPKVRPICLLDEIGKAFERILAERIYEWQENNPESSLAPNQFGFRKFRSTCDALKTLKDITAQVMSGGGLAIVVSLDIRNAFNSIPWSRIRRALRHRGYPVYLQRILDSYLADRNICYVGNDGRQHVRPMEAGVPQGSVLGPVLWNIAFDSVLRIADDEEFCEIICYADDTLVIIDGKDVEQTLLRASVFLTRVVNHINRLGLSVAMEKTEAIVFRANKLNMIPDSIVVNNVSIKFAASIKYLGIMIDSNWAFKEHLRYAENKADGVVRALNRLMPNLRGPDERRRRLFANVVYSVILYGAPFWGDVLLTSRARFALRRLERSVAQRVISAYRTVSSNAALLLARMPPLRLLAPTRKRIYERCKEYKDRGEYTVRAKNMIKEEEFFRLCNLWRAQLERPNTPGEYTKLAIVPQMDAWLAHDSGSMSFHITQIMTGHGCFSRFLCRIGKRDSAACDFCDDGEDDATHTLKFCSMWNIQRERLREKLGLNADFSLGEIVDAIIVGKEAWTAFSAFAEDVMRKKEEEERRREMVRNSPHPSPLSSSPG